jgi:hypothetical protein
MPHKDMQTHKLHVPDYIYDSHIPLPPRYAPDHSTAAKYFLYDIQNSVKICKGRTYVLKDIVWTSEPVTVNRHLLAQCMSANIHRVRNTKSGPTFVPLTGEIQEATHVIKGALALLPEDPLFEDKLWGSSIGSICFKNGVYDFHNGTFSSYDQRPDIMTKIYIPRDFPVNRPDPAITQELLDRVFISTLGNMDVVSFYLAFKARALAGNYSDKQWAIMLGERNCGKGLLQELDKMTFPGYVNEVNANSFLLKQYADGDAAKAMSWAVDCEFTRITYTNEIRCDNNSKTIKLDGNLLKAFQSGGDGISARKNYQDEKVVKVATRLFMNANDIPEVAPKDALETMLLFKFPYKFVTSEQMIENPLPFFKIRDDTLKSDFCHRQDVCDAYIWLLIDAYNKHQPTPCKKILNDTSEYMMDIGDESSIMDKLFIFTGNKSDFVTLTRISEIANSFNIKKSIIKDRLVRLGGCIDKNCCVQGVRHGRGIIGIKLLDLSIDELVGCMSIPGGDTASHAENCFREALEQALGYAMPKVRPAWLCNPKTGCPMELDFFDADRSIAIEYDGPHHYEYPNKYHKTKQEFHNQQERDKNKERLCKDHGICLIRVKAVGDTFKEVSDAIKFLTQHEFKSDHKA